MPEEMNFYIAAVTDEILENRPPGTGKLINQLAAAADCRNIYALMGIDDSVFINTMKCFSRYVREHMVQFGCYGYDRESWAWRHLSLRMFRLGVLEFEPIYYKDGRKAISVHIPSDSVMTREALDASYKQAMEFEPFGDYRSGNFYCSSWLLAPVLKELLPESSRIRNFMNDYEIIKTDSGDSEVMRWVYKKEYPDIVSLPEETSLQRAIKKHLLSGGHIGEGIGIYKYL